MEDRTYEPPTIAEIGTVHELTLASTILGAADGGQFLLTGSGGII